MIITAEVGDWKVHARDGRGRGPHEHPLVDAFRGCVVGACAQILVLSISILVALLALGRGAAGELCEILARGVTAIECPLGLVAGLVAVRVGLFPLRRGKSLATSFWTVFVYLASLFAALIAGLTLFWLATLSIVDFMVNPRMELHVPSWFTLVLLGSSLGNAVIAVATVHPLFGAVEPLLATAKTLGRVRAQKNADVDLRFDGSSGRARPLMLISDTHFTGPGRKDLIEHQKGAFSKGCPVAVIDAKCMVDALREYSDDVGCILHAGDITDVGSQDEWNDAIEWLKKLGKPVIACPGNHDVNMRQYSPEAAVSGWWARIAGVSMQYEPSQVAGKVLELFAKTAGEEMTWTGEPVFPLLFERGSLEVLVLDSNERAPGNIATNAIGRVSEESLASAKAMLERIEPGQDKTRILLLHHHVVVDETKMALENAAEVLSFARENGVDWIIHGHHHRPRVAGRVVSCGSSRVAPDDGGRPSCYLWRGDDQGDPRKIEM